MLYKYNPWTHRKSYRWVRDISKASRNHLNMNPEKFRSKKLYHYTSLTAGTLILLSQKIRMSRQSKMNDINESYRTLYSSDCDIEDVYTEMNKYFQSSFTVDDVHIPGFAIPTMWGHYANRGKGMCLVFDKYKLLSKCNHRGFYHGIVTYSKEYESSIIVERNPKEYFNKNKKDIFLTKSDDWSYEREYRIVCRSECTSVEIDISGCIIAVIVYQFDDIPRGESYRNSLEYKHLVSITKKLGIPVLLLDKRLISLEITLTNENNTYWYGDKTEIKNYKIDI